MWFRALFPTNKFVISNLSPVNSAMIFGQLKKSQIPGYFISYKMYNIAATAVKVVAGLDQTNVWWTKILSIQSLNIISWLLVFCFCWNVYSMHWSPVSEKPSRNFYSTAMKAFMAQKLLRKSSKKIYRIR